MQSFQSRQHTSLFITTSLLLLLGFVLVSCSNGGSNSPGNSTPNTGNSTATATIKGSTATTTATFIPTPVVKLGVQPCPDAVKDLAHWDAIIGTQSGVSKVGRVTCANLIGTPTLQALILVEYQGTGQIADIYVYTNITDPAPIQIFKLQNLYKGDARISSYNTVLTAEVDQNSSINKEQPNVGLTQDLFREFKWSDGVGTLVQVSFPGIFPDLTRYQAEADQGQVNQGHQPWKLSATLTTQALGANLLKWNPNAPATLMSGGGAHDVDAVVKLKSTNPGSSSITAMLSRLEGNTNGGIWEVISVTADGMSITSPQNRDRLTSPTAVTGTGNAFEGKIGRVTVLDHLYTDIGHAGATGAIGNGNTTFSTNVTYTSSFQSGAQEGLVALYAYSNADGSIAAAIIIKEMLG